MTKTSFYHALVDVQKSEWVARKAWVVGAQAFACERQAWGNHPACAEEVERIDRRTAFDCPATEKKFTIDIIDCNRKCIDQMID